MYPADKGSKFIRMRFGLGLVLSIFLAAGLIAFSFTFFQVAKERKELGMELEIRTADTVKKIFKYNTSFSEKINRNDIENIADSINSHYNFLGTAIYFSDDSIISTVGAGYSRNLIRYSRKYISKAVAADSSIGNFIRTGKKYIYQYIKPVKNEGRFNMAVVFYTDAGYIDKTIDGIWIRSFIWLFFQTLLVSLVTVLIIHWRILDPLNKIVNWIKAVREGKFEPFKLRNPANFFSPLLQEVGHIVKAMHEAKANAEEEARLRKRSEAIWTPERLKVEIENLLHNRKMIVVSNREPYMHIHEGKKIKCIIPASGMITAMEPILKASGGLWIASGTGDADKETVDKNDKIRVPPDEQQYSLRRLWITKEDEEHFYYGFSNEGLWPLCHIAHTRPIFRKEDWHYYKKVNEYFAKAVLEETIDDEQPFILIQDFHFALLPEMLKKVKPKAKIAIFWHIPWPNPESFGICPWQKEILYGMLGADLIGFHTQYHCNHFLETVNNTVESIVLWENFSINIKGQTSFVKAFPISIAFTLRDYYTVSSKIKPAQLLKKYFINAKFIGIGVDRLDYTKGIIEKFLAIERFLEKNPSYVGEFTFIQIGAPSRTHLKSYNDLVMLVKSEANRINLRFKTKGWKPILLLGRHHSHEEIEPFYSSANLCMVTSLHDGMNLVAKEFVASRNQNDGALILSCFTGASQELVGAIIINPYDIEKSSDAIKTALEMTKEEQYQRMKQMRQVIAEYNIYSWAADLLRTMASLNN